MVDHASEYVALPVGTVVIQESAFSLVELIVAVGIVGVLVTLAWPRYQEFMVQARRGEAKSNLSHLSSLQTAYKVDHYSYYMGPAMTGSNGIGYREGAPRSNRGFHSCDPELDEDKGLCNYLGFYPEAVGELRYFYRFTAGTAIASAASDRDGKHIYPDCRGGGAAECGYTSGDALTLALSGNNRPVVCRNVTKYCPVGAGGGGGGGGVTPPPCPPTPCPPGQVPAPWPVCCTPSCGMCQPTSSTSAWTPDYSARCSSETSLRQTANVTQSWNPPPACPTITCRASTTEQTTRVTQGGTAPICIGTPGVPNNACPCEPSDTRPCCVGGCTKDTSSEGDCNLVDTTIDLDNKWICNSYACEKTVTTTYTPDPPCAPTTETVGGNVFGNKNLTCDSESDGICTQWGPTVWGNCSEVSSGVCQEAGSATRTCNNPCPNRQVICRTGKEERRPCTCPTHLCVGGEFDNETTSAAKGLCDDTDTADTEHEYVFLADPDRDGSYACECKEIPPRTPQCTDKETGQPIPATGPTDCRGHKVWHDAPTCKCECDPDNIAKDACDDATNHRWDASECKCEVIDGTQTAQLCFSSIYEDNFKGTVGNMGWTNADVRGWEALKEAIDENWDLGTHARTWERVYKKLQCGGNPYPGNASVKTFIGLLLDNSYGAQGCSDPNAIFTVTWTCS